MGWINRGIVALMLLEPVSALALDSEWAGTELKLNNRLSVGARWRMEDRDDDLIGKLAVPGQQNLYAPDDCS